MKIEKVFRLASLALLMTATGLLATACGDDDTTADSTTASTDLALGVGHFDQTVDADGLTISNPFSFSEDCRSTGSLDCETGDDTLDDYIIRIVCTDAASTEVEAIVCRDDGSATSSGETCDTTIDPDGTDGATSENDDFTFVADVTLDGIAEGDSCTMTWEAVAEGATTSTLDTVTFDATDGADIE